MSTKKKSSKARVAKSTAAVAKKSRFAKKGTTRQSGARAPGSASMAQEAEINPQQRLFASRPTGFTLWLRRSLIWQSIRFIVINIRMLFMISKAQPTKIKR